MVDSLLTLVQYIEENRQKLVEAFVEDPTLRNSLRVIEYAQGVSFDRDAKAPLCRMKY